MNDFGFALAWLALQVALVLAPALIVQSIAARRNPTSGAWIATSSLALVILLGATLALPTAARESRSEQASDSPVSREKPTDKATSSTLRPSQSSPLSPVSVAPNVPGWSFAKLRSAWMSFEQRAAAPVETFRPWSRILAYAAIAASTLGLIRLALGLWAVEVCRRRGRLVVDGGMRAHLEELRVAMGCRREVELREVSDLATPATAGWFRPFLLLPDDWRSWDDPERRAVVAHELAHIVRGDYASALVARIAVVMHSYHPLVRWMAGRLALEQELAADALGAEFAGGRPSYLLALSRLALMQEGRSSSGPARAFLPARGTLIRRIKMLRDENGTTSFGFSRRRKWAMGLALVALTVGASSLKAPAKAADEPAKPAAAFVEPFDLSYVREGLYGVVAIRPAATFQRTGMRILSPMLMEMIDGDFCEMVAGQNGIDTKKPGFIKIGPEDVESIISAINIHVTTDKLGPVDAKGERRKMNALDLGEAGGLTVRMVAPFDWLAFLRQWKVVLEPVKTPHGLYYKITSADVVHWPDPVGIYLPDERTLVYEKEVNIVKFLSADVRQAPAYLRGADWDRVSRDLLAVAVNNHDDMFIKMCDIGRTEDRDFLKFFRGVERWIVGVADTEKLTFRADAISASHDARVTLIKEIEPELKKAHARILTDEIRTTAQAGDKNLFRYVSLYNRLFDTLLVEEKENAVAINAKDFASFADIAVIFGMSLDQARKEGEEALARQKAEAEAKKVNR